MTERDRTFVCALILLAMSSTLGIARVSVTWVTYGIVLLFVAAPMALWIVYGGRPRRHQHLSALEAAMMVEQQDPELAQSPVWQQYVANLRKIAGEEK